MVKIAPEVFMWLHIEWPAATNETLVKPVVILMLRWQGCCWQLLNVTNKVTCNLT